ncbi:MAG: hypothetical protein V4637_16080 [Pseudomonadota bacterium]
MPKGWTLNRVAQVAQSFEQWNPRAAHLLDVEAEVDEIAPCNVCAACTSWSAALDLFARDEIEAHATQPQLEVGFIDGFESAAHRAAGPVYGLVLE